MSRPAALLIVALLCSALGRAESPATASPLRPVGPVYGPVALLSVRDGDTVVVDSNLGPRTIRLIGIDAPEVLAGEALGAEAARYLEYLLPPGAPVWLETDLGREDIYGRLLAYVYVAAPDGRWNIGGRAAAQVNLKMMEAGWARTLPIPPNVSYADLYDDAATAAGDARLGVWAPREAPTVADDRSNRGHSDPGVGLAAPSAAIVLHCALVNPDTPNDTAGEWVSVLLSEPVDTRGYYLYDEGSKRVFRLPVGLQAAGEIRIDNPGQGVWNNGGDVIYLKRGEVTVDSWAYRERDAVSGRVLCRDGA